MFNRSIDSTCEHFSESAHQVELWISLDSLRLNYSWRWSVERIYFCRAYRTGVFQNLSIWSVRFITPGGDRHLQRIKGKSSLAEKRTMQIPSYKGGGTEIGLAPLREWWIKIHPNPRVACRWLLHFLASIELGRITVPNEQKSSQYPIASFSVSKDYE